MCKQKSEAMTKSKAKTTLPSIQSSSAPEEDISGADANGPESQSSDFQDADSIWNYETTVAEIEAIVDRIESGDLELAELFSQFEIAVNYLRQCERFLQTKQQHLDLLVEVLEEDA